MLLTVSNVAKAFGVDQILTGVTFKVGAGEKVALVGRNGTGKTTLLRIITQQYGPDKGSVNLARGAKVGYLRQEAPVTLGRTVLEEAQTAMEAQLAMRRRLDELETSLAGSASFQPAEPATESMAADLEEYALLHEHFLEAEGYSAERDIRVVLLRMGFSEGDFDKATDKLSGGEKTRLAIARLLLEEPDLLILDEPTNHLDLQATEWLEGWLRQYHGAVLLVSHDRAFLENTAERVLEMRDGIVKSYPGPFAKFLKLKEEEDARQAEVAKQQDREIAKMDEYVRRFMNSQRTAQARGRQKLMNRLIETKVDAPKKDRGMAAGFGKIARSGDVVMEAEKLSVGFAFQAKSDSGILPEGRQDAADTLRQDAGATVLFKDLNWTVRFGDRWGVIGENGSGKSTLIKVVLGLLDPLSGKSRVGSNVTIGYFSQDTQELDPDQSPLDYLVYDCDMLPAEARNLLGRFLFSGDDVYRQIKTLSGGEKNKLSLARLTNLNPNLLILDEPTNHLDMDSREALAKVMQDYKGTLVLISHDRWLLTQVTNHTLDVRRAGPVVFNGSYLDFRQWQARCSQSPTPSQARVEADKPGKSEPTFTPRELSKEIDRLENVVQGIERQVSADELALKELEGELANLPTTADVFALTQEHQRLQESLEGALSGWEEQSTKLEQLRAKQG